MNNLRWRKSSYSVGNPEQCVEVSLTTESALLRNSKNPTGEVLTITRRQLGSLLASLRPQP